jgi:UDP-glucose 4-epimerase
MNNILVTGGAGYIGSHLVSVLCNNSDNAVVVIDNLSNGHRGAVDTRTKDRYWRDIDNPEMLLILKEHKIKSVFHLAGCISVAESVKNPIKYYKNNVEQTVSFMGNCVLAGVKQFVFSSSAAVYAPKLVKTSGKDVLDYYEYRLTEQDMCIPASPYGWSKLMVEKIIKDAETATRMKTISLRYFNVAGASMTNLLLGERHKNETHLIPCLLEAVRTKKPFKLYGNDYPNPDGTAIRDYVHVLDVAAAHVKALDYLKNESRSFRCFNIGTGVGFSVKEIIHLLNLKLDKPIEVISQAKREGDIACLIADISLARDILHWSPQLDITSILQSAYTFSRRTTK